MQYIHPEDKKVTNSFPPINKENLPNMFVTTTQNFVAYDQKKTQQFKAY